VGEQAFSAKTPQQVENVVIEKRLYQKHHKILTPARLSRRSLLGSQNPGNKDVPDYHPGIVRCTEMGKSKDA